MVKFVQLSMHSDGIMNNGVYEFNQEIPVKAIERTSKQYEGVSLSRNSTFKNIVFINSPNKCNDQVAMTICREAFKC